MVEMTVDSVRVSMGNQQHVVILKERLQDRYLFIWIGQSESNAIVQELKGTTAQRPLTHDLLKSVISNLGGKVVQISITELRQSIYYARIIVEINGRRVEIDARPSDAIALAVRVKCPIFAAEEVLAEAAVIPEDTTEKPASRKGKASSSNPTGDDLAIYRDFINSLDILDDFGKSDG